MSSRDMLRIFAVAVAVAIVLGPLAVDSQAYKVTWDDGSTVHTVFEDNMEGAAGTAQTTSVGTWSATTNYINADLSASAGPPAAFSGSTYIERYRGSEPVSGAPYLFSGQGALLDLSANGGNAFTTGNLNVQFVYWIPVTGGIWLSPGLIDNGQISPNNGDPATAHSYIFRSAESTFWGDDSGPGGGFGGANIDTGAQILAGQWNLMEIRADLELNTSQTCVNAVCGSVQTSANDSPVSRVYYRTETANVGMYIDAVSFTPSPDPTIFTWRGATPGNWQANSNWMTDTTPGSPNGNNHQVTFGTLGSSGTVAIDQPVTVHSISFDNSATYAVGGIGEVSLAATTDAAPVDPAITVSQGSHQFQVNVALQNDATADIAGGSVLEFNNRLFLNGNTLTKTGDGTLSVNNNLIGGSGSVQCQAGVCNGTGTIGGNLSNSAVVAPGNNGSLGAQLVPEPTSLFLLVIGLVLLVRRRPR